MLVATRGHFVPQVVDLYVVCQYARSFAEGHPFRYNPGEPPSTGATSLLHTVLLAGAHALGARGEGLVAVAVTAGAGFYMAAVLLARRIAARLGGGAEGLLAGGLLALGGPVVWGFLYGSDMALFMLLCLWLLERAAGHLERRAVRRGGGRGRALRPGPPRRPAAGRGAGRRLDAGAATPGARRGPRAGLAARGGRRPGAGPLQGRHGLLAGHVPGRQVALRELRDHGGTGPGERVRRRRGARPAVRLLPVADPGGAVPGLGALLLRAARAAPGRPGPGRLPPAVPHAAAGLDGRRRARRRGHRGQHLHGRPFQPLPDVGLSHRPHPGRGGPRDLRPSPRPRGRGAAEIAVPGRRRGGPPAGPAGHHALRGDLRRHGGRRLSQGRGGGGVDRPQPAARAWPWPTWPPASST